MALYVDRVDDEPRPQEDRHHVFCILRHYDCPRSYQGAVDAHAAGHCHRHPGIVSPDHFAQLFSTHGTIMVFFVGMPLLSGLMNFAMPLQIGARDVAFPYMNSISLWLTVGGGIMMMASLVFGDFSTGGVERYPPYTELGFNEGVGPD